jgi:tetratricopeptide (TPR) repeat protein
VLDAPDSLAVLEHLVDQSLLKVADDGPGVRFRMLETVREFSALRRDEAGETDSATERFLAWARDVGVAHHAALFESDFVAGIGQIRPEQDNLQHALRLALDRSDGATVAAVVAVLGGLWTIESSFVQMATLAGEPVRVLSHYRPPPALVEPVRTALLLAAISAFVLGGGISRRAIDTLRRLPPAPPTTLIGAADTVLRLRDFAELPALCESDEPSLAAVANAVASYGAEAQRDLDAALAAAARQLRALDHVDNRWYRAVAHSRMGELYLAVGRTAEAVHHLTAVLPVMEDLGADATAGRLRWGMAFAAVRDGSIDEAERWLAQLPGPDEDDPGSAMLFGAAVRAEIWIATGDVDAGLALWRRTAAQLRGADDPSVPGLREWATEVQASAVIAHAFAGRLEAAEEIVAGLPDLLVRSIALVAGASDSLAGLPSCGALVLGLALVDLSTGQAAVGARMVALAEQMNVSSGFQSPRAVANARRLAEHADGPAYADASSEYAGLDREGLLIAASAYARTQCLGGRRNTTRAHR